MPWELRTWLSLLLLGIASSLAIGGVLWAIENTRPNGEGVALFDGCFLFGTLVNAVSPMILVIGYHELPGKRIVMASSLGFLSCLIGSLFISVGSVALVLPVYFSLRMMWRR